MKLIRVFMPLFLVIHLNVISQNTSESFLQKTEYKIGYFGNIAWDNGLSLGVEYPWIISEKVKTKRGKKKTISNALLLNGSFGYSTNFENQVDRAFSTQYGIIWRRTNTKGKQLSLELNPLGYTRTLLPETYEVVNNQVNRVSFPGRNYYSPSIALGIGKQRKNKIRSGWYFNLRYTLRTPYNAGSLPLLSFEYGYRLNFKPKK
ncbi:MAG: hypothetical protein ACPGSD_14580 [Flavobacteriales bacterium]